MREHRSLQGDCKTEERIVAITNSKELNSRDVPGYVVHTVSSVHVSCIDFRSMPVSAVEPLRRGGGVVWGSSEAHRKTCLQFLGTHPPLPFRQGVDGQAKQGTHPCPRLVRVASHCGRTAVVQLCERQRNFCHLVSLLPRKDGMSIRSFWRQFHTTELRLQCGKRTSCMM